MSFRVLQKTGFEVRPPTCPDCDEQMEDYPGNPEIFFYCDHASTSQVDDFVSIDPNEIADMVVRCLGLAELAGIPNIEDYINRRLSPREYSAPRKEKKSGN